MELKSIVECQVGYTFREELFPFEIISGNNVIELIKSKFQFSTFEKIANDDEILFNDGIYRVKDKSYKIKFFVIRPRGVGIGINQDTEECIKILEDTMKFLECDLPNLKDISLENYADIKKFSTHCKVKLDFSFMDLFSPQVTDFFNGKLAESYTIEDTEAIVHPFNLGIKVNTIPTKIVRDLKYYRQKYQQLDFYIRVTSSDDYDAQIFSIYSETDFNTFKELVENLESKLAN